MAVDVKADSLHGRVLQGDVMEQIARIPDDSVDVVFTSPPYFALRDYDTEEQWGLEPTIREYLDHLMSLMEECRRVVKPTGNIWVNLGDTYATSSKYGVRRKSLMGIPERFLVRAIDDGFVCRNKDLWKKENPTPSSAWDRLTNTYEPVYFFSISDPYFFDLAPIRVRPKTETKPFNIRVREARKPKAKNAKLIPDLSPEEDAQYDRQGVRRGRRSNNPKLHSRNFREIKEKYGHLPGSNTARLHRARPGNPNRTGWDSGCMRSTDNVMNHDGVLGGYPDTPIPMADGRPRDKNPGDIVSLPHQPLKYDHFAAFPVGLPLHFLPAACPRWVCKKCGKPRMPHDGLNPHVGGRTVYRCTVYVPLCKCGAGWEPGLVLDPFAGAGTTTVASKRLGFRYCGIEINAKYVKTIGLRLSETEEPPPIPPPAPSRDAEGDATCGAEPAARA
ncbi:MAG: site-specific DNA-methyltransferase [Nitrosopumilaceae archaeon]|nr:site-specific DNA-methyltransferase [Nitrosopumilaceae archaeon]